MVDAAAADIHATAVVSGDVTLGEDVVLGPGCVIDGTIGPITIGDGCRFIANVYVTGPLTMGRGTIAWPGVALGTPPQDVNYDPLTPGSGIVIGDNNVFREGFTAHRGKTDQPTRIGNDNYCMANSHVGHDSVVGNNVTMANSALLGGHVQVADSVIMGGGAGVHQFCRIGRGAFLQGNASLSMDLPPWLILTGLNTVAGVNLVGMRRSGMDSADIKRRREIYRMMYHGTLAMSSVVKQLRSDGDAVALEYADFIESSQRGLCARRARRGSS